MKNAILTLLFSIVFQLVSISQVIYVTTVGAGIKEGSSWANALAGNDTTGHGYTRLADTMRVAISGSQFWVAEGTYLPSYDSDRNKSFEIPENIAVYGGFKGNETTMNERDWEANETVFFGNIGMGK